MNQSPQKHIVLVSHSYPRFKGDWHAHFIEALALAYARKARVTVLVPYTRSWNRQDKIDNVRLIPYKYLPWESAHVFGEVQIMEKDLKLNKLMIFALPFLLLMGVWRLRTLLKNEKVDMIQAHWAIPNTLVALLGRFLSGSKAKVFTSFPGSDVTVLRSLGLLGKIIGKVIGKSDYLSCNSHDLRDELVSIGLPEKKIDLVIYGVDHKKINFDASERESVRTKLGLSEKNLVLLLIGRFVPKKGFSLALNALPSLLAKDANIKLLIVGSGPLKTDYEEIINKHNLSDSVIFVGSIPTNELVGYYSACDIFLMPSQRLPADGLNVVVPEAMACARPIVATNVGGNELVIFHGQNGYLHDEKDHLSLARHVLAMAQNNELMISMGASSRELIENRFNWDAIADYYLSKV